MDPPTLYVLVVLGGWTALGLGYLLFRRFVRPSSSGDREHQLPSKHGPDRRIPGSG